MLVLKSEPETSIYLAELVIICLKESCFPDCWKVSSVFRVFKNAGEMAMAKNYCSASLLSLVCKIFKKLVNNRLVDHLQKYDIFSDFQYSFKSSWSTVDYLTVVLNKSRATQAVLKSLIYQRLLTGFGIQFFSKSNLMEFQVRYLSLFCLFFQ